MISSILAALGLLLRNIAPGAFHNAAERGDPPRCHEETRIAIRAEIMEWIKGKDARRKFILWLYGPAGAGKTAIAQSIAEACEQEGLLAASFFFSRGAVGRGDLTCFAATIAYQLSRSIPEIECDLLTAIEKDPAIFSRTLSVQMQALVVGPLEAVLHRHPLLRLPSFMMVDGVDECGPDGQSHSELLDVLGRVVAELKYFPFILLISSRPEYEIREAFSQDSLSSVMKGLVLDDTYKPDEDIKRFLNSALVKIQRKQVVALGRHPPIAPWPTEHNLHCLVKMASGQFIFAATVVKFLDSPRHDPVDRLNVVLGLAAPGNQTPFALLDKLYRFILSSVADLPKVLEILAVLILADRETGAPLTMLVVEELLGYDIRRALIDMHALVYVPPSESDDSDDPEDTEDAVLRLHHASLHDFLMDRSRSREYFIDAIQGHITLSQRWIQIITNYSSSPLSQHYHIGFALDHFIYHSKNLPPIRALGDILASFKLGDVLEGFHDFQHVSATNWSLFFDCVKQQVSNNNLR